MRSSMHASNRRPRSRWSLALTTALLAGLVASCAGPEEATDLPEPSIVWENGEPTGGLWDTDWRTPFLAASVQLQLADAYGDYSDPDFIAAVGYDFAARIANVSAGFRFGSDNNQLFLYGDDGTWAFYGGVLGFEVEPGDEAVLIHACHGSIRDDEPQFDSVDWTITKLPDGSYLADYSLGSLNDECADVDPWIGAWAEPIDILDVGRDEVKMPLPREYYVDLGVISE